MSNINFIQGKTDLLAKTDDDGAKIKAITDKISEFFNMKNVYFLFGSGTSSDAVPIMRILFEHVKDEVDKLPDESKKIFDNIELATDNDFEELLGILYSQRIFLTSQKDKSDKVLTQLETLIDQIEKTIFNEINVKMDTGRGKHILEVYKKFYRKVSLRNKDLSRVNIFTTNNDLFNETALDSINVNYINGFNGGLNKFFNPALFNYSFSKRMDTSIEKYEPVENIIYLYKLHGSINWIEDTSNDNSFFDIKEIVSASDIKYVKKNNFLIFPTPIKQDKSLGSPYTELFREFQKKLLEQHSVLFVIGYGFNDAHVNNIIHQALATNSSMNIVIFKEPNLSIKLSQIDDNRIFKVWGEYDGVKIHYFEHIVDLLLDNVNQQTDTDVILSKFITSLKAKK